MYCDPCSARVIGRRKTKSERKDQIVDEEKGKSWFIREYREGAYD